MYKEALSITCLSNLTLEFTPYSRLKYQLRLLQFSTEVTELLTVVTPSAIKTFVLHSLILISTSVYVYIPKLSKHSYYKYTCLNDPVQ